MVSVMTWYSFYLWNRSRSDRLHKLGHRSLCYSQLCSQVFLHNLFVVVVVLADCSIGQHHLDHLSVMLESLELYRRGVALELALAEHLILSLLSSLFFLQIWIIYLTSFLFSDSIPGYVPRIRLYLHSFTGITSVWWYKTHYLGTLVTKVLAHLVFLQIFFTMNI